MEDVEMADAVVDDQGQNYGIADNDMEEEEEIAGGGAIMEEDELEGNHPQHKQQQYEDLPVSQEDAWAVISAYFEEKGLVRQQLDYFDEFIQNTMQELVDDSGAIRVSPEYQHVVGYDEEMVEENEGETKAVFSIEFGQVYLSKPTNVEKDGTVTNMVRCVILLFCKTQSSATTSYEYSVQIVHCTL